MQQQQTYHHLLSVNIIFALLPSGNILFFIMKLLMDSSVSIVIIIFFGQYMTKPVLHIGSKRVIGSFSDSRVNKAARRTYASSTAKILWDTNTAAMKCGVLEKSRICVECPSTRGDLLSQQLYVEAAEGVTKGMISSEALAFCGAEIDARIIYGLWRWRLFLNHLVVSIPHFWVIR